MRCCCSTSAARTRARLTRAHGAVDLGRADGIGHVDAADGNAARNRLALLVREGDVVGAREAAERFVVAEGNPVLQRLPGDAARYIAPVSRQEKPSSRATAFATVDLPAPLGPSMAMIIVPTFRYR